MGKHFGELAFIRGIVYYKLSPHEQKPFAGAFTRGVLNVFQRTSATVLYWLPRKYYVLVQSSDKGAYCLPCS